MDYEVTWSPEAVKDVGNIAAYIGQDSAMYATAVVDKIVGVGRRIKAFPKAGRIVPS